MAKSAGRATFILPAAILIALIKRATGGEQLLGIGGRYRGRRDARI
jgi:hypothetical protein